MHQSGHSRAHSMHTVQFSSNSAITPRLRGGRSGAASGYCRVIERRVIVRSVTASPLARPPPGSRAIAHHDCVQRPAAELAHPLGHPKGVNRAYHPPMAEPLPNPPERPPDPAGWRPVSPVRRPEPEGLGWAFVPLLTCGFGTSPAFAYAAVRSRSGRLAVVAGGYGAASAASILLL